MTLFEAVPFPGNIYRDRSHALRSVFEDVVKLLAKEGLLSIGEVNTDGTRIEANANKYTFVWKRLSA